MPPQTSRFPGRGHYGISQHLFMPRTLSTDADEKCTLTCHLHRNPTLTRYETHTGGSYQLESKIRPRAWLERAIRNGRTCRGCNSPLQVEGRFVGAIRHPARAFCRRTCSSRCRALRAGHRGKDLPSPARRLPPSPELLRHVKKQKEDRA